MLKWAAVLGASAVALGAFGAHGLKQLLPEPSLAAYETGVKYQVYHSLALIAVYALHLNRPDRWLRIAGKCFIAGIFLFAGSLYAITLLKLTPSIGVSGLGLVTPVGGLFFIAGWLCLLKVAMSAPA